MVSRRCLVTAMGLAALVLATAGLAQTQPATTAATSRGSRGGRLSATLPPPVVGEGPTCALDATIYDVRLPVGQISRLDAAALTRAAASAADFEKALGDLGTVKPLYRANQAVRLSGDTIMMGAQVPYVTNSQTTSTGQVINSVSYTQVGAFFNVAGKKGGGETVVLDLTIQLSGITEGGVAISTMVAAPMFRTATLVHKGTVTARQPFVLMSADATNVDGNGKAVAYIARVTLGVPEGAAEGGRGD
jgi:hypothetical protein